MKFVIHHHRTVPDHFDLMIEKGTSLLTWQIKADDFFNMLKEKTVKAVKINNHRKEYLTYEGPISCDRGMVEAFDSGEYNSLFWSDSRIEIVLRGEKINKILIIEHLKENFFSLRLI